MARSPEDRYAVVPGPGRRRRAVDGRRAGLGLDPSRWTRTLLRWLTRHRTGVTGAAAAVLAGVVGLSAVLAVQSTANARLSDALIRETAANSRVTAANAELTAASEVIKQSGHRAEARRVEAERNGSGPRLATRWRGRPWTNRSPRSARARFSTCPACGRSAASCSNQP